MTINPCCIPLKTGVRMVTHLSMALALAVGWAGLKLISISLEVSSSLTTTGSSSTSSFGGGGMDSGSNWNANNEAFYNNPYFFHNYQHQQNQDPDFKIPYEYILYQKWHQQQQQNRRKFERGGDRGGQDSYDDLYNRPPGAMDYDEFTGYHRRHHLPPPPQVRTPPPQFERGQDENPILPLPPPLYPPPHSHHRSREKEDNSEGTEEETDEQSKIFRSIMRHRKNFKETSQVFRDSEREREDDVVRASSTSFHQLAEGDELTPREFPSTRLPSSTVPEEQGMTADHLTSSAYSQREDHDDEVKTRMMIMKPEERSQNTEHSARINNLKNPGRMPNFKQKYAKALLICGLLAVCTVVFQFFTSFLLLCFVDKGSNAAAQIWTAVNCSVIFCLATCLVLFLCEGVSMPKYTFDETLYLSLVTVDSLLSIYFLWVVMAFI